jgi:hypothetical protein
MRGLSEEHLGMWCDELRETIKPLPYPDENGLRAELDQISTTRAQPDSYFVNTSILDEIKKSGFVDKLYKQ